MCKTSLVLLSLTGLLFSTRAEAHIALESPTPRGTAQKQGPCGATGSVRGPAQTFAPGETITVTWDETVDHVGHYRIAFDLDGHDDFPLPVTPEDDFPTVLVDQITDRQGGGKYSQEITFPEVECDNCTLQLIQVMTTNVPYNSFYFQCSDIVLSGPVAPGPDAGTGGGGDGSGNGDGSGGGNGDGSGGGAAASGGCSTGGSSSLAGLLLLGFASLAIRRRRGYCRR